MLIEIRVRNYAVISELIVELHRGLNVLTGETGAGKSVIVGALALIMGARGSVDVIRAGAEKAIVEAVFDVHGNAEIEQALETGGFDVEEGLLILRREIAAAGRNRAWVNGSPATVSVLASLGSHLVDIHGQHEHQSLSRPGARADLLDAFAGCGTAAARVRDLHREDLLARDALTSLEKGLKETAQRAGYLRFKLSEIEKVNPTRGEDDELRRRASTLEHSEDLAQGAAQAYELLYEQDGSLTEQVDVVRSALEGLSRFDPALAEEAARVGEAGMALEEVGRALGDYASRIDHDPAELARLRSRLDELQRIGRKYGPDLDDVLAAASEARRELEALDCSARDLAALTARCEEASAGLERAAAGLTELRDAGSARLAEAVAGILPALGMEGARFVVELAARDEITDGGAERIDFLATANPGFDPAPLSQVTSGGELSRIMLALRAALASAHGTPVLVFDEVDAGVGGAVANSLGTKLAEVASEHQVIVVTHLAQVASKARTHLVVEKAVAADTVTVSIRRIRGRERVGEIARMLGGDPRSAASRRHARELLGRGRRGDRA